RPVTQEIREQWTPTGARLDPKAVAALVRKHEETPRDLAIASELASRYIALNRKTEAAAVIEKVVSHYDSLAIARGNDESLKQMLSAAYLQLSRAETQKDAQVIAAQLAYNISPTVGYV